MFEAPSYTVASVVFMAAGSVLVWCRLGRDKLSIYGLSPIFDLLDLPERMRMWLELMTFVFLGCLIGGAIVQPLTAPQAIAAGMGWTGLLAQPPKISN